MSQEMSNFNQESLNGLGVAEAVTLPKPPFAWETAAELLKVYGSPLYVYDRDRLRHTIQHITQAIPYPRTQFRFASVTNGNVALLQIFRAAGWGLHANTPGDAYLGLKAGFLPERMVYSGSNLSAGEIEQLLGWGVRTFNLDSLSQVELFSAVWRSRQFPQPPRLGLRLNLPAVTGDSRIGVRPEEFSTAVTIAGRSGLTVDGLHFYRGTGTNATRAFTEGIAPVLEAAQRLPNWAYLDFGGGFGYPYHHNGAAFDWNGFGAALTQALQTLDRPIDLVIEPGRAAIAGCATLLATVISTKWQGDKQIVGMDTTVANLSVPSVHGGYREVTTWQANGDDAERFLTDVCGNTTYSRDYLSKNGFLPRLKPGDVLAILDVGAYGYAMSSHFLHRPRPAEVLLEPGSHRLIRQREDYDVLLANQVFEERVSTE